jgi:hypothetical protein
MTPPRFCFTIRGLMLAVGVVAVLLALSRWRALPLAALSAGNLIPAAMLRQRFLGFRRLAAVGFGAAAAVAGTACAVLDLYWPNLFGVALGALVWFAAFPVILGLGAAWASSVGPREQSAGRPPRALWTLVLALTFLPLTMLFTHWPFRLAFLASRPALDRLADRVADGQAPGRPIQVGLFRVVGSIRDRITGNVGLVIDPDSSGRSGFVRLDPGCGGRCNGPFYNLTFSLKLGEGWWYDCED